MTGEAPTKTNVHQIKWLLKNLLRILPVATAALIWFLSDGVPQRRAVEQGVARTIVTVAPERITPHQARRQAAQIVENGHFVEFGILFLTLVLALSTHSRITVKFLALAVVLSLVYAGLDEIHQSWVPGRAATWRDFFADSIGVAGALLLVLLLRRHLNRFGEWLRNDRPLS